MSEKKVLLIEDDDDDQEIFLAAIDQLENPVACIVYNNPVKALKALEDKVLEPDIIFLDLNMPLMNGQQFLVHIKNNEALEHIPVIVLSTSSHASSRTSVKSLGATDFFSKPNSVRELVEVIKSVLV